MPSQVYTVIVYPSIASLKHKRCKQLSRCFRRKQKAKPQNPAAQRAMGGPNGAHRQASKYDFKTGPRAQGGRDVGPGFRCWKEVPLGGLMFVFDVIRRFLAAHAKKRIQPCVFFA